MKRYVMALLLLTQLLFLLPSCVPLSCEDLPGDPVLDANPKHSEVYQKQLVQLLQEKSYFRQVRYYFDGLYSTQEELYMTVNCRTYDFCGTLILIIPKEAQGLAPILKTEGNGYFAAELVNLKWEIHDTTGKSRAVYKGLEAIID